MSDLKKEYKQLTNVDIEEQKRIWDERGKGYYGEYLVLQELCRFRCTTDGLSTNSSFFHSDKKSVSHRFRRRYFHQCMFLQILVMP